MADYTPTTKALPERDRPIEWISYSGQIVRGTYCGVWLPEGSDMYVYYQPAFWRYVEEAAK